MYVLVYCYDPARKTGYVYLPGKGEKWYDVNVGSIYRGVEGHWFQASGSFGDVIESSIRNARATAAR